MALFNVGAFPTFIFLKNGKEVGRHVGATDIGTLSAKAKQLFGLA